MKFVTCTNAIGATLMIGLIAACSQSSPAEKLEFSEPAFVKRTAMFEHIESLKAYPQNPNAHGWWNQMAAAAGREDLLHGIIATHDDPSKFKCSAHRSGSAIANILQILDDHTLVIISEHHAIPAHRSFIQELVVQLKHEGFTHYAAETLTPEGAQGSGYPTTIDGWYTTEPIMARLLMTVRGLGYAQIAYEQRPEQRAPEDADQSTKIRTRENAQVQNLRDAILDEDPNAKLIVHVGHSHAAELPVFGTEWMAARLKKATGIDPLTISLTACHSDGVESVLAKTAINARGDSAHLFTDYMVGLPLPTFENGRPSYRAEIGDIETSVPVDLQPSDQAVIIEARPVGADLDQEPVERLYLAPGESLPLMLPEGTWSLISFDESGEISEPQTITVGD